MKNEIRSYIEQHGGLRHASEAIYRELISSDFVHKVTETFGTRILLIAIGLITSVIVARSLGPEGRGLYAVAMTIGAIGVQIGNFGLQSSQTYYVAKDQSFLSAFIGNSLLVAACIGGGSAVVMWFVFKLWPNAAPLHGILLLLALLWIPLGLSYTLFQNLLLGIHEIRIYNKIELIAQSLAVATIGLFILLNKTSVESLFSIGLSALFISAVWSLLLLVRRANGAAHPSLNLLKSSFGYGIKAYLATFFAYLVLRVDLLMVKYMLGAEQTGYYSIAVTMADMVFMFPSIVALILFPKLSGIASNEEKWRIAQLATRWTTIVMICLTIIASLLARPIIHILFGESFYLSIPAFLWLMPGILFLGIQVVAVQFLNSIGFPKIIVYIWGSAFFLNVGLNIIFIPKFGIVGASIVSSFSYFLVFVFVLLISWKFTRDFGLSVTRP